MDQGHPLQALFQRSVACRPVLLLCLSIAVPAPCPSANPLHIPSRRLRQIACCPSILLRWKDGSSVPAQPQPEGESHPPMAAVEAKEAERQRNSRGGRSRERGLPIACLVPPFPELPWQRRLLQGDHEGVIRAFERGEVASTESTLGEYIKALVKARNHTRPPGADHCP